MSKSRRSFVVLLAALSLLLAGGALAQGVGDGQALEPLPLEVAVSLRGNNGRSPVHLSPDGEWIAHTVMSADTVPRGTSRAFASTSSPGTWTWKPGRTARCGRPGDRARFLLSSAADRPRSTT